MDLMAVRLKAYDRQIEVGLAELSRAERGTLRAAKKLNIDPEQVNPLTAVDKMVMQIADMRHMADALGIPFQSVLDDASTIHKQELSA